jgi:hypothetical protein
MKTFTIEIRPGSGSYHLIATEKDGTRDTVAAYTSEDAARQGFLMCARKQAWAQLDAP